MKIRPVVHIDNILGDIMIKVGGSTEGRTIIVRIRTVVHIDNILGDIMILLTDILVIFI